MNERNSQGTARELTENETKPEEFESMRAESLDTSNRIPYNNLIRLCIVAIILALLSITTAIALGFSLLSNERPSNCVDTTLDNIKACTDATELGSVSKNQAMTYFLGYDDQYVKEGGMIALGNDWNNAEDNIYMQYTVIDEAGKELFTSDLIAPGKEIQWHPSDHFPVGEHKIVFHEQPYKIIDTDKEIAGDNLKPLYYVDQNIMLTIIE